MHEDIKKGWMMQGDVIKGRDDAGGHYKRLKGRDGGEEGHYKREG